MNNTQITFDESIADSSCIFDFDSELQRLLHSISVEYSLPGDALQINPSFGKDGVIKDRYLLQIFEHDYPTNPNLKTLPGALSTVLIFQKITSGKYAGSLSLDLYHDQYLKVGAPTQIISANKPQGIITVRIPCNKEAIDYFGQHIRYRIENYKSSSSFGCCSRYKECSAAGRCLHNYYLYATGCSYRQHLKKGEVFYK